MLKGIAYWTGALIIVVAQAGCGGGAKLNAMDEKFESLYFAKVEGTKVGDDLNVAPAAFGLAILSKEAKEAGDKVSAKDWRTAVAFYRIAALSAWQAGERGSRQIFAITDKGRDLCKDRLAEAPRDCTLMLLVAPLAVHDELAPDLQPINKKANDSLALEAEDLARLKTVFDDVKLQFDKVSDTRGITATTGAPPTLLSYIDRQRFLMFCTAKAARDLMFAAVDVGGGREMDSRAEAIRSMEATVAKSHDIAACP